jgi:pSer/pThr/pTyr-binding forkhead associated (FHA) protein
MNPSAPQEGGLRRWQVPASSREAVLPEGFRPLLLKLPAQQIELELRQPEILVGRHTLVDLCLPYPDVSRKHCRLVFCEEGWQVVDMGSLNGVEINGKRTSKAELHEGDTLRIANLDFEVHVQSLPTLALPSATTAPSQPILKQIAATLTGRVRKAS